MMPPQTQTLSRTTYSAVRPGSVVSYKFRAAVRSKTAIDPENDPAALIALSYDTPLNGISLIITFERRSATKYLYFGAVGSNVDM